MNKIICLSLILSSFSALSADYFTEIRVGVQDEYAKEVDHAKNGTLKGDFKGTNVGLRGGKYFGNHVGFLEFNPKQDVEVKSANELAKVQSFFVGYRYQLENGIFFGGQLGHSSFELEKGPNGVTFVDNPKTSGITYGVNAGYRYKFSSRYLIGVDAAYNFGSYKDDGPSSNPVNTIEIKNQMQLNISFGIEF